MPGEEKVEPSGGIEGRQWDRLPFSGEIEPVQQHKVEGPGSGVLERGPRGGDPGEGTPGRGYREGTLGRGYGEGHWGGVKGGDTGRAL